MKESTGQLYKQRILNVQMYIQQNLDRDLSLKELRGNHIFPSITFTEYFALLSVSL